MPPKLQLDKAAWQWAESTEPHNVNQENVDMAYRLNLKPCSQGACKRNCRGNPFCLNAVGEKAWFAKLDEKRWNDFDPQLERREKGSYVGLKNLGATCYVNTFLQLWFHNLPVRRAVYRWVEPDMPDTPGDDWTPATICGHLQVIFALLQFSCRRYVDPSTFINHLGLDAGQQQDAQEFSKLFLSLLEDAMSGQSTPGEPNIIQQQFCGEYCYVTRCKNCGTESRTGSKFYELDLNIKGHKVLKECIEDFLKEEKLEGENQYMCEACASKQNASRAIRLLSLPPILNMQLLRFVFDKNSGHKKKINSFVQFPEVLDMSKYVRQPEGSVVYELTAVLIHRGPSAYSGHYVAHIKTGRQQPWYKFNDEDIEEMKGKNLHLGTEEEMQESSKEKKGRVAKGSHSSKNAYMLVYTRQGTQPAESAESCGELEGLLSLGLQQYVMRDNDKFEEWVAGLLAAREDKIESGKVEQEEIRQSYLSLIYQPGCETEWLSYDWITKWLSDPSKVSSINNKQFLCQHHKLDPDMVPKLKCVNSKGAASLAERYKADIRLLGGSMLCWSCVRSQCHVIRMKQQMTVDEKLISAAIKLSYDSETCYWVGKSSLRSWKRLAIATFHHTTAAGEGIPEMLEGEVIHDDKENGKPVQEVTAVESACTEEAEQTQMDTDSRPELQFNTDLLCCHDCLSPDRSCRRLIPETIWRRLRAYFPACPEYTRDHPLCGKCQQLTVAEEETKGLYRQTALTHKASLSDLFAGRNRPKLVPNTHINIVSNVFIEEWRRFIKENGKREPVSCITNSILLCEHGGLLYPPTGNGHGLSTDCMCLLWPSEWMRLIDLISFDIEISAVLLVEQDGSQQLVTSPEICENCVSVRLATEESNKFIFKDCVVYVRKIVHDKKNGVQTAQKQGEATQPATGKVEMAQSVGGAQVGETTPAEKWEDPDYTQLSLAKKKKLDEEVLTLQMAEKILDDPGSLRRKSQRHRKTRGEKEVLVSSDMTLKDLKIKIMKQFSVPPFDQNLSLEGVNLTGDSLTLQDLRVSPGAVIILQADEAPEEAYHIEDLYREPSKPEKGFQGTNLLSS